MDEERYRAVFSQLHSSIREEDLIMENKRHFNGKKRIGTLVLAAALALAISCALYANGGFTVFNCFVIHITFS